MATWSNRKLISKTERRLRIKILTDLIHSYHVHLGGRGWHSRLSDVILFNDMLVVGEDLSEGISKQREHVVPCKLLFEECFKIFEQKKESAKVEVESLLDKYLKVVIIDERVSKVIDTTLGLKTSMPEGHDLPNCSPYCRINIGYSSVSESSYNNIVWFE
ncbi:hypothetical protein HBN50_00910 [Halobacteriovorax sp. GB3]|uniref:hypothetical protein n=1 Tax=Halobacteriovorax sp. GB3 TaxID=2719615 RepID=UPI00236176F2|nr:hypothetical protein [Halobacteriovorax sp. GB3]MDD0851626.1 hypothetical protein [Halobacteriovorax sp. GB3]